MLDHTRVVTDDLRALLDRLDALREGASNKPDPRKYGGTDNARFAEAWSEWNRAKREYDRGALDAVPLLIAALREQDESLDRRATLIKEAIAQRIEAQIERDEATKALRESEARVEAVEGENRRLRAALEPFAAIAATYPNGYLWPDRLTLAWEHVEHGDVPKKVITLGDLWRAEAALRPVADAGKEGE